MKLGRVRLLMVLFAVLALILLPLGCELHVDWIITAALGCFAAAVFVWFGFYRCPHCHKFLGRSTKIYCPYCREKL